MKGLADRAPLGHKRMVRTGDAGIAGDDARSTFHSSCGCFIPPWDGSERLRTTKPDSQAELCTHGIKQFALITMWNIEKYLALSPTDLSFVDVYMEDRSDS